MVRPRRQVVFNAFLIDANSITYAESFKVSRLEHFVDLRFPTAKKFANFFHNQHFTCFSIKRKITRII